MQAPDLGNGYNRPRPGELNGPRKRRILAQREVRAGALVLIEVRFQDAPQTGFIYDDQVIQAFPTNRADQSLNVGVLPGRLRCRENLTNAQPACCLAKFPSVAPIAIARQVMRGAVPRKGFQQLVSHPFSRGIFRHCHVDGPPAVVGLDYQRRQFVFSCRDNGRGFDLAAQQTSQTNGHWGLRGIAERAEKIGGKFSCVSATDKGTDVQVSVPRRRAYVRGNGFWIFSQRAGAT